jgi:hypothetical protein
MGASESSYSATLPQVLAGLRREAHQALQPRQVSGAARTIGVHRNTLRLWLRGNDNVSVWTLCQIAAWLAQHVKADDRPLC